MHLFADLILHISLMVKSCFSNELFFLKKNIFKAGWMSLSLRNVFSTLKSNLKTARSAKRWRSSFPSGMYAAD